MKFQINPALFAALVMGSSMHAAQAIIASPHPFKLTNADGTSTGLVRLVGGPQAHHVETVDGWSICSAINGQGNSSGVGNSIQEREEVANKSWFYCDKSVEGDLVPRMDLQVGSADPQQAGLLKGLRESVAKVLEKCGAFCDGDGNGDDSVMGLRNLRPGAPQEQAQRKLQGSLKNLVVIFKFSDHANKTLPSQADINILMNADSPVEGICPTGSVKQVFLDNSNGDLVMESFVAPWVTLDSEYTEAYCSGGSSGLVLRFTECLKNALDILDPIIDFDDFNDDGDNYIDAIAFLHSGFGAEFGGDGNDFRIWSHKWQMPDWTSSEGVSVSRYHISPSTWWDSSDIGRIGVIGK
jgi:hypothetical protein